MILGRATTTSGSSGSGNSGGRPPRGSGSSASLLGRSHFLLLPFSRALKNFFFPFSCGCNQTQIATLNYIEFFSLFFPKRRQILFSAHL